VWGGCGLDLSDTGQDPMADSCEHGNEPSRFHKRQGIFWLAEQLLLFQQGLCFMNIVS
jgi:hypothetical protein